MALPPNLVHSGMLPQIQFKVSKRSYFHSGSVQYIGSKKKLIPFIQNTIHSVVGTDLSDKTFCDMFAGTAAVGRAFKTHAKQIIANDVEYYAFILNRNYIGNSKKIQEGQQYIGALNQLPLIDTGFIYKNYCQGSGSGRQYFSDDNGKKIDTLRQGIEKLRTIDNIGDDLYYFLLASLLEGTDKTATNTAIYCSFLKHLSLPAQQELLLEPANFELNAHTHQVFNENANTLIKRITGDILYLDPPYTNRQYGEGYHLLNSIALYDNFVPKGKTGKRAYNKSAWCSRRKVAAELDDLLRNAQFKYIFLSYNNEGLMSADIIKKIMEKYGRYDCVSTEYRRFKSDNSVHKANRTTEFIHILEKR
jgi:adenine-specific DNA-methyltransferase